MPPSGGAENGAAAFASLNDWFTGTQFDATQPFIGQTLHDSTNIPAEAQGDALFTASSDSNSPETTDSLFAALGFHAPESEYSLPLGNWDFSNGEPYNGPTDFEELYRAVLESTS